MNAPRLIQDRPFLRLFEPDSDIATTEWTVQKSYESFRAPELLSKSKGHQSDARRWVALWHEFETDLATSLAGRSAQTANGQPHAQRITHPLRLDQVRSRHLQAFAMWLIERGLSASSANKAVGELRTIIDRASQEGVQVQTIKTKRQATAARPRYYYDDEAVARLWDGCTALTWPPRHAEPKAKSTFAGSGLSPATFWRCILILLRNYGMRVQDLIAYAADKSPLTWDGISYDPRSPSCDSLERWPLGWIHYTASKTGQVCNLPITPSARAALDRLRAGAFAIHRGPPPSDVPIFACPKSHGLTDTFIALQKSTGVATRDGREYQLEDFRKTVATYSAQADHGLPYALCGWGGSGIKERNYQNQDPLLVRKLHMAPLPPCFNSWTCPQHTADVKSWVADNYTRRDA